jgi:hypothetical protein
MQAKSLFFVPATRAKSQAQEKKLFLINNKVTALSGQRD